MRDPEISLIPPQMSRSGKPLILVVEHDRTFGTRLVQLLKRETCSHAILARGIAEAHCILQHLQCDAIFLYRGSFSQDDLDRLSHLPQYAEMPPFTLLAGLPLAPDQPETWHLENLVKSIQFIRYVRNDFGRKDDAYRTIPPGAGSRYAPPAGRTTLRQRSGTPPDPHLLSTHR